MGVTLSIIVPAYNVEKYLESCIYSIMSGTYRDFEILLIDDGSTDKTGKICDCLQREHKEIKVFHTENRGLPLARNLGIDNALGQYIGFVDADDLVAPEMFDELVSGMNSEVQMCICGFLRSVRENVTFESKKGMWPIERDQIGTAQWILRGGYGPYVWNKLYRKDILDAQHIRFLADSQGAEDQFFNAAYLQYCTKAVFFEQKMYGYVTTEGSITSTFRTSRIVSNRYVSLPRSWRYTADVMGKISAELTSWSCARAVMFYQTVLRKAKDPDVEYVEETVCYLQVCFPLQQ